VPEPQRPLKTAPPRMARLPRFLSALRYNSSHQVSFHTHDAVELVYCVHGNLIIECDGGMSLPGTDGMLYVLPANVAHNQRANGPWQTWCVLYYDGDHILPSQPRAIDLSRTAEAGRWIDELCSLYELKESIAAPVGDGLLFALLGRLAEIEHARHDIEALHPRLADAVRFLHEHSAEDVDADTLAGAACASYSHLSALFRDRFNCGPLKYHQNLRMELAKKLLMNPYLTIDEVAQQTGFEDTNYFVRLFKRAHGAPPGKWRKALSGKP
jgi:AraC-like DNA-binding protein